MIATRLLGRRNLFRVGSVQVPSYTVMLYLGCMAGTLAGGAVAGAEGLDEQRFVLATVLLLVPALIGARLLFVFGHPELFRTEPGRIWRRGEGGSALYGGLILSVAVSVPVLALADVPFARFWDAASVTMLVGLILTRFGCTMNGCCVGRETSGPLGVRLPDRQGRWKRRYPTPILEAASGALILVVVLVVRPALPFDGALFAIVLAAYAVTRILLEPTREQVYGPRSARINIALSMLLLATATAVLAAG